MIHNPKSPGRDDIAGGHPATLDLGDGMTFPYGGVCTRGGNVLVPEEGEINRSLWDMMA